MSEWICKHCGEAIFSKNLGETWKHYCDGMADCVDAQTKAEPAEEDVFEEPVKVEGKHRFMAGTCVDCGKPLADVCVPFSDNSPMTNQSGQRGDDDTCTSCGQMESKHYDGFQCPVEPDALPLPEWNIFPHEDNSGDWVVEATNPAGEGQIYTTIFSGSDPESRGREYLRWNQAEPDVEQTKQPPVEPEKGEASTKKPIELSDACAKCGDNRLQHASLHPYNHKFAEPELPVERSSLRQKIESNLKSTGDWMGRTPEEKAARLEETLIHSSVERPELPVNSLLEQFTLLSKRVYAAWNYDQDMKVGKLLGAMCGDVPGYSPDVDSLRAELLAAQSRISQLEKERDGLQTQVSNAIDLIGMAEVERMFAIQRAEKAEAERDQLKRSCDIAVGCLEVKESLNEALREREKEFKAKLATIDAITNTPEWFDTPCARAVRKIVGEKN